jgi:hypothetical protein
MKHAFLTLLLVASTGLFAQKQPDPKVAIRAVIETFFEGMRKGDSAMVAQTLHPEADLYTTFFDRSGVPQVVSETVAGFLEAVSTPREEIWDERISNVKIQVSDNLASVWMDYAFYVDKTLSHKGVNAIQLVFLNGSWKILHITDTRERRRHD